MRRNSLVPFLAAQVPLAVLFAAVAAALMAASCGYQLTGSETPSVLKPEYRKMAIKTVENPSLESDLVYQLRSMFRDELTKRGGVTWVDRSKAKSLVTIDVRRFDQSGWVEGYQDKTLKYESLLLISARIENANTGEILWDSGEVKVADSFFKGQAKESQEQVTQLAVRRLADRLIQNY